MKFTLFVVLLVVALLGGAGIFLATWDIPAPTKQVEVVVPNDRFPR